MAPWHINEVELRAKWNELSGLPPSQQEMHLAQAIANRLARDDDDGTSISPYEILREVRRATEDPRHFLHLSPRPLTATTLVVLLSLSSNRPVEINQDKIREGSRSDEAWLRFWQKFFNDHVTGWDKFLIGAWDMAAKSEQYGILALEMLFGGASFLVNAGDSVDVRLNVLATKAVTIAESIQKKIDAESRLSEIDDACARLKRTLAESGNDATLLQRMANNEKIFSDLHLLFEFIAMNGKKRVSLEALEVLIALHTDVYQKRSLHPVGLVTDSFPAVDGTDKKQVMEFLHGLGIVPQNDLQAEHAWAFWQQAWNQQEIHAGDVGWDMDRTLYQYKLHLTSGKEYLRMDPVIIKLVAVALRDKRPNVVVSNAIRARIADFANHPDMAAFRFAFFLRMPSDPHVTVEEIASMPNVSSYEELMDERIHSMMSLISDPVETIRRAERLLARSHLGGGEVDRDLMAGALSLLQSVVSGPAWEGVKFQTGLRRHQKIVPSFLVDDNRAHVRDFVKSGGLGGVVVPYLDRHTEGLYVPAHPVYDPFSALVDLMRRMKADPRIRETIVTLDKETNQIGSREDFPPIDVRLEHKRWGWKVWEGWVRAGRVMVFTKLKLIGKLVLAGKLKQARKEAQALFGAAPSDLAARQLSEEALAEHEPPPEGGEAESALPIDDMVGRAVAVARDESGAPTRTGAAVPAVPTEEPEVPGVVPVPRDDTVADDERTEPGADGPPSGNDDRAPKATLAFTVSDRTPLRIGDEVKRPQFDGTAALAIRRHPADVVVGEERLSTTPSTQAVRLREALIRQALLLDLESVPGFLAKLPDENLVKLAISRAGLVQLLEKRGLKDWAEAVRSSSATLSKTDIVLMVAAIGTGSETDLQKLAAKTGLLPTEQSAPAGVNPALLANPAAAAGRVIPLVK